MYKISTVAILLVVLSSCASDIIFDEEKKTENPWKYGEDIRFQYTIQDTMVSYDIELHIVHSDTFPYENVYMKTHTQFPSGDTTQYAVSFQLADGQGKWLGDCSGGVCETIITMTESAYFKKAGQYTLRLEQFSRQPLLSGINGLRLIVKKHSAA